MSDLLKQKCSLVKLREELEEKKRKLYRCCKKFGHLAQNCRNRKKKEKRKTIPQDKFEMLSSRVMQSGERGQHIRRQEEVVVECFKYREKGHKCRKCPKRREESIRRVEKETAVCCKTLAKIT